MAIEKINLFEKTDIDNYLQQEMKKIEKAILEALKSKKIEDFSEDNFDGMVSIKTQTMKIGLGLNEIKLHSSYDDKEEQVRIFTVPIQGLKTLLYYKAMSNNEFFDIFEIEGENLFFHIKTKANILNDQHEKIIINEYQKVINYIQSNLDAINLRTQESIQRLKSRYPKIKERINFDNQLLVKLKNSI